MGRDVLRAISLAHKLQMEEPVSGNVERCVHGRVGVRGREERAGVRVEGRRLCFVKPG